MLLNVTRRVCFIIEGLQLLDVIPSNILEYLLSDYCKCNNLRFLLDKYRCSSKRKKAFKPFLVVLLPRYYTFYVPSFFLYNGLTFSKAARKLVSSGIGASFWANQHFKLKHSKKKLQFNNQILMDKYIFLYCFHQNEYKHINSSFCVKEINSFNFKSSLLLKK